MKEFMRTVKQTFQVGWQDLVGTNVIAVFAAVVGVIVVFIISPKGSYGSIGSFMSVMFGGMPIVIGGVVSIQNDFNLAISLGKTRKYYVPARALLAMASWALCLTITVITAFIEEQLYTTFFPDAVCEFSMMSLVRNPGFTFGLLLFIPMLIMLAGALLLKFGMKCFWVFWVFWMFGCIGIPRIISAREESPNSFWGKMGTAFVNFFEEITDTQIVVGLIVLGIVGLVTPFLLLRKQRVTL